MAALRHKTVMLVTHQVEFLSQVEKILVTRLSLKFDEYFLMYPVSNYVNKLFSFCISRFWKVDE